MTRKNPWANPTDRAAIVAGIKLAATKRRAIMKSKSTIKITFKHGECCVDADVTVSELRHAVGSLMATFLQEAPEELNAQEREFVSNAVGVLLIPIMDEMH